MESLREVAVEDFEAALTPQRLRALQLVHSGFGLAMVLFGLVVVALHAQGMFGSGAVASSSTAVVEVMTVLNFVLFCACWVLGSRLFSAQFSPQRLRWAVRQDFRDHRGRSIANPATKCVVVIVRASILRLACLDFAASFGFATCLVAVALGVMRGRPVYWINAAPSVLLIGYILLTVPTADRLRTLFLVKIAGAWRSA